MRIRLGVLPAFVLLALVSRVPVAMAAAEIHRLNLVFSAVPTSINGGGFNESIDEFNRTQLEPRGLEPLERITHSWLVAVEGRYFVRQNIAVTAGVGRIHKSVSQEYLPSIGQSIVISAGITSIPFQVGGAYYFRPYNQGDFQARAYVGAGVMSVVYNRASVRVNAVGLTLPPGVSTGFSATNDAPGYFGEVGMHMFFATKYSVILSGLYRNNEIRTLVDEDTGQPSATGSATALDMGGIGFRFALAVGL